MTIPSLNILDAIRSIPSAKLFHVGGIAFAQFHCPGNEDVLLWTQTDYLLHVLSSKITWKNSNGISSAGAGETVFFKKGAFIDLKDSHEGLCIEIFFVPDSMVRKTVIGFAANLPALSAAVDQREQTIRVKNDATLSAFLQAMTIYFTADQPPAEALLELKVKELVTSIVLGNNNPALSAYFRSIVDSDAPPIAPIMEANFHHNLPIETFAEMCHRSLSSFKRDFRKLYGTSPGRWLVGRRLSHAMSLLQHTQMSITQISFECGFEDLSHFSRAFKDRFGRNPSAYRAVSAINAS